MRFAADENFNNNVVRGMLRVRPELDVVRVQDVGLSGVDDPEILEWCAGEGRVTLTHDRATMVAFAAARLDEGESMPGLIAVDDRAAIRQVIEDLVLIEDCVSDEEISGQIWFVPM